jgi:hypothetical protein
VDRARGSLETGAGDCADVVLEVEGEVATLTFTTTDGRRAVRVLHDPAELAPILDALLVTLPERPAPSSGPQGGRIAPERPPLNPAKVGAPPPPTPIHALVSALVGGRLAGPGTFIAPTVNLGAGVGLSRWEFEVTAQWSPTYALLADDQSGPAGLASIGAGLAAGRRTPLGRDVALVTGVTLSAAAEHEGWHTADPATGNTLHQDTDRGQALVGAYAATVFPTSGRTRFRSSLAADVDATHLGDNGAPVRGVPALPWWGLTLALGVESEVL